MILQRSNKKELMDDFSLNDGRIDKALKELHRINRYLGGNTVSNLGIRFFKNGQVTEMKIADIGGGASDILYDMNNEKNNLIIYSVDLNKYSCRYQKKEKGNNNIICADALKLPLKEKSFDVVHASLFLHHFEKDEIVLLIRAFLALSRNGIVINDLRRNIFAYSGIKILTAIFSKSEFVKNDGPLSVRRGFIKKELVNILTEAGVKKYLIRRKWAFRFLLIIPVV